MHTLYHTYNGWVSRSSYIAQIPGAFSLSSRRMCDKDSVHSSSSGLRLVFDHRAASLVIQNCCNTPTHVSCEHHKYAWCSTTTSAALVDSETVVQKITKSERDTDLDLDLSEGRFNADLYDLLPVACT